MHIIYLNILFQFQKTGRFNDFEIACYFRKGNSWQNQIID